MRVSQSAPPRPGGLDGQTRGQVQHFGQVHGRHGGVRELGDRLGAPRGIACLTHPSLDAHRPVGDRGEGFERRLSCRHVSRAIPLAHQESDAPIAGAQRCRSDQGAVAPGGVRAPAFTGRGRSSLPGDAGRSLESLGRKGLRRSASAVVDLHSIGGRVPSAFDRLEQRPRFMSEPCPHAEGEPLAVRLPVEHVNAIESRAFRMESHDREHAFELGQADRPFEGARNRRAGNTSQVAMGDSRLAVSVMT